MKCLGDLVADDQTHGAVDTGADSGQLGNDVDALLFVFNHFLNAPKLAFGPFEAVEDIFFSVFILSSLSNQYYTDVGYICQIGLFSASYLTDTMGLW